MWSNLQDDDKMAVVLISVVVTAVLGIVAASLFEKNMQVAGAIVVSVWALAGGVPFVILPLVVAGLDAMDERRRDAAEIRKIKRITMVEEIQLRHRLNLERIQLEHQQVTKNIREVAGIEEDPPKTKVRKERTA